MNYYQNSKNGYSMNNKFDRCNDESYYNEDNKYADKNCCDNYNDKNDYCHKKSCCVRRVEETFCCFPSYYTEEKQEDEKEKCFEGTFKICPKRNNCEYAENDKCKEKQNNNDDQNCGCRCHNRCGLCRLFRLW